jgi:enediyne polyketide synthase
MHFVLVHHGSSGAAFAKTLHLEVSGLTTTVVELPAEDSGSARAAGQHAPSVAVADRDATAGLVAREVAATVGFAEVRYDREGRSCEPVLRLLPEAAPPPRGEAHVTSLPLGNSDLLLVTGGGKGIAAECAFDL